MIQATPKSICWDEINQVQYKFQELSFRSDVIESLRDNSRQFSSTHSKPDKSSRDSVYVLPKHNKLLNARLHCIGRSASLDSCPTGKEKKTDRSALFNSKLITRKSSVVQLAKDDTTSDYNSDEEVFSNTDNYSMDTAVSYNAILCHVTNRKIIDTVEVYVTNKKNSKIRSNFLSDGEDCPQASTSPSLSECQLSRSAPLTDQNQILSSKSKEELIEIIKRLEDDLRICKSKGNRNGVLQ